MAIFANVISTWLKRTALLVLFSMGAGSAASAQTSQADQRGVTAALRPGRTVWITDPSGREEKARIIDVSRQIVSTAVDGEIRRLRTADVMRVRARQSDSLLDGALIGAGAAVAAGLFLCTRTEPWENCRDDAGPIFRIGALGAGLGMTVDALIRGRKTIYQAAPGSARIRVAPLIDRHARGLRVSVSF